MIYDGKEAREAEFTQSTASSGQTGVLGDPRAAQRSLGSLRLQSMVTVAAAPRAQEHCRRMGQK